MTPEQTKSAYQRVCEQECEWCARGHKIEIFIEGPTHIVLDEKQRIFVTPLCSAPSKEAFIERQAAQIAAMQAALAKASHHRDCNTNGLICKNCDKWFREHGIATDACPDRNSVFEEVRGCNCYLSTLSDDIERGKELLGSVEAKEKAEREYREMWVGALRERDEATRAMNDGIRQNAAQVDRLVAEKDHAHQLYTHECNARLTAEFERDEARATSQRQAVEIEELRKVLAMSKDMK